MPIPRLSFLVGLFIGVVTVSEITLIPAVYIGYISGIPLAAMFLLSIAAAAATDIFWYAVGYFFPKHKIGRLRIVERERERAQALQDFYQKHKLRMCFYCKFLHGTQIFFQVMAGGHRLPFLSYLAVSLLSTVTWFLIATAVTLLVTLTVGGDIKAIKDLVLGIQVIASITLLAGITSYVLMRRLIKQRRRTP